MYFAVDCETGAIHVVDEAVRDAIDLYPSSSREELAAMLHEKHGLTESEADECLAEIDELAAAGKLFAKKRFSSDLVAPAKRPGVLRAERQSHGHSGVVELPVVVNHAAHELLLTKPGNFRHHRLF